MKKEIKNKEGLEEDVLYTINILGLDSEKGEVEEVLSKDYTIEEISGEIKRLLQKEYVRECSGRYKITNEGIERLLDMLNGRTVSFKDALGNLLTGVWKRITCTTWTKEGELSVKSFYTIGRDGYSIVDENGEEQTHYGLRRYDLMLSGWKEYR